MQQRGTITAKAMWGDQADANYEPTWKTYKNHTTRQLPLLEEAM